MDFQLDSDQQALLDGLQPILADRAELPMAARNSFAWPDPELQRTLAETGFLGAARDMGGLEGVLVTLEAAKLLVLVETGVSGLVAGKALADADIAGPAALVDIASLGKPVRNLPIAESLMVIDGDDVRVLRREEFAFTGTQSVLGYPYGLLDATPGEGRRLAGRAAAVRQWAQLAIAAEVAGAARAALDFTLDYVRQRHVLGRSVGSFQTVQHRLAWLHAWVEATRFLALRAGWSEDPADAAQAHSHAMQGIPRLMFDLHQFNGGMGMTTEYPLHFWLYRIRALQGEAGGGTASAQAIADLRWGAAQ